MKFVNLGCGNHYHKEWINFDFRSNSPEVIQFDLTKGIPLDDVSSDVIYASHLLEHFNRTDGSFFIADCYRVLKPNGILRLAVPDLEKITRLYLVCLEQGLNGLPLSTERYNWIILELLDQLVRTKSGGYMREYFSNEYNPIESFVFERIGSEGRRIDNRNKGPLGSDSIFQNKRIFFYNFYPQKIFLRIFKLFRRLVREKILSQEELAALEVGKFRLSGEVHQWMYDRYSLSQLLISTGFQGVVERTAMDSYISNWTLFNLDTQPDGSIYKPDSLYVEARK